MIINVNSRVSVRTKVQHNAYLHFLGGFRENLTPDFLLCNALKKQLVETISGRSLLAVSDRLNYFQMNGYLHLAILVNSFSWSFPPIVRYLSSDLRFCSSDPSFP